MSRRKGRHGLRQIVQDGRIPVESHVTTDRNTMMLSGREALRAARQQSGLRADCIPWVARNIPNGWNYSEERARSFGKTDGWYGEETKFVVITPDEAHDLFARHNYDHNRPLIADHAEELAAVQQEGLSIDFGIGPDNHPIIVNGQHTIWGIFLKQEPMRCKLTIYQCRDKQSIAILYASFDSGRIRSASQILKAEMGAGVIECSVSPSKFNKWLSHARIALNGFTRHSLNKTNTARMEAAKNENIRNFVVFMEEAVLESGAGTTAHGLVPQGIGAAFFAMFTCDQGLAREFISGYLKGAGLEEDDPRWRLRDRLFNKPRGFHADTMIREYVSMAFVAWRKFCEGGTIRLLRGQKEIPAFDKWKVFMKPEFAAV